jgi:tetratricopeptide (TPR) repeat protein
MLADLEECAFQLSLRPNARSFARYMKELFEEEVAEEELALRAKIQTNAAGEPGSEKNPARDNEPYEDTILSSPSIAADEQKQAADALAALKPPERKIAFLAEKLRHLNSRYVGLILWLIFLLALVILAWKNLPFARQQPEVSADSAQTASIDETAEFAKLSEAKAALQAKRYTQAAALFEELFSAAPSMRETVSEDYAKALQGQASDLVEKAPQEAQQLLLKALAIEPGNIAGLSQLGYLYLHQRDYPRAIETYQKIAELDPQQADTFFNLGYVYAITAKYHQAKAMYLRVVELAPAFTDEALFNLAFIHEKLGERDQCIKSLEHAIELNPANESARNYLQRLKQSQATGDKG